MKKHAKYPKKNYFIRRTYSFRYALTGIKTLILTQPNAQIHFVVSVFLTFLGILMHLNWLEWSLISLCMGLVWVAESLNTAVEFMVDLVSPDYHELAKKAKDVAAAGVLLAATAAICVGLFVLGPRLWTLLGSLY